MCLKFSILSRNFTGEDFQTGCSTAEGRLASTRGGVVIVTGALCILLDDLVGKNLERVVLGHSAALNRQRAWMLGEIQEWETRKKEKHLSEGTTTHKLEQKA